MPIINTISGLPLIELKGVTRSYGRPDGSVTWALKDVSLQVHSGEFVCITGPSGAGKSTLLNILGCLDRPSAGSYRLADRNVNELASDSLAWLRREIFGFVFQDYHLIQTITAQGNIELPGHYSQMAKSARRSRARELLAQLGVSDRAEHFPSALSGGEQQRVCIARALMNGGRVILADEPTGALDQQNGERVLGELEALARKGHTVIMVSHNPEITQRADRRIQLRDGQIVADKKQRSEAAGKRPLSSSVKLATGQRIASDSGGAAEGLATGMAVLQDLIPRKPRLRGILSVASVAIAVWWIISLTSLVGGITQAQFELIDRMDANHIALHSGGQLGQWISLALEDTRAIEDQIVNVRSAAARLVEVVTVQKDSLNMRASVRGDLAQSRSDSYYSVPQRLEAGAFISPTDNDRLESVAVIGPGVRNRLFEPSENPVGQFLTINSLPFRIKGVALAERIELITNSERAKVGESLRTSEEDFIYVPYQTAASLLFGSDNLRLVDIWVDESSLINETAQEIRDLLVRRHGNEGFTLSFRAAEAEEAIKTRNMLNLFIFSIGGIALLAGGLGVMNIMLMSVTGRRREIGMRIAIGARRSDIQSQFLMEAVMTVATGGLLGLLASALTIAALALIEVPVDMSVWVALAALASIVCTGIASGILPARRAARLDPVLALAAT